MGILLWAGGGAHLLQERMKLDPLTRRLCEIAFGGALITVGFGVVAKRRIKKRYEKIDAYNEALEHFVTNRHIINFLGEPIRIGGVDLQNRYTAEDSNCFKFAVKAAGSKSTATLYVEADKVSSVLPDHAHLTSLEVELQEPRGRLKIV